MERNISQFNRIGIIILKNYGLSWQQISQEMREKYKCIAQKRTMQRIWKKYQETGSVDDKERSGRPRITSPRNERIIKRICLRNRVLSTAKITGNFNAMMSTTLSSSSVRNILRKYGIKSYAAVKKPFLTLSQRKRRVVWAKEHSKWDENKWSSVVFSDESLFQSFNSSQHVSVKRTATERLNPACIQPVLRHGPQVHVWGSFSLYGTGVLKRVEGQLNAEKYQREIINDIDIIGRCLVFPQRSFIFQQDLAPPHRANSTREFLEDKGIEVLKWPGNSPDLNPIENIWGIVNKRLNSQSFNSSEELAKAVQSEWYAISSKICKNLIRSMPRRIKMVIKSKGFPIKY